MILCWLIFLQLSEHRSRILTLINIFHDYDKEHLFNILILTKIFICWKKNSSFQNFKLNQNFSNMKTTLISFNFNLTFLIQRFFGKNQEHLFFPEILMVIKVFF